jgi:hypothetical protein
MRSIRLSFWLVLLATLLVFARADATPPPDPVQNEFDRFVDLIADGMWVNGRITTVSAQPDASDDVLILEAAYQLNARPGPLKKLHILKKEHVDAAAFNATYVKKHPERYPSGLGGPDFSSPTYLIAVIESDQGHKIIAINEIHSDSGTHWARMYNCDAVFSSPQAGGTPLIR